MNKIEELKSKISDLDAVINDMSMSQDIRNSAMARKAQLEIELTQEEAQASSATAPSPSMPMPQQGMDALTEALAILRMVAMTGGTSGVNSDQVNKLIEKYLNTKKIDITQLDKTVLDEIKKNQKVIIEIPSLSLAVQMTAQDAKIQNIFSIMDDVLAGNNVYLIGEAGGGKTFAAERVAAILKRELLMINCSQYTSPTEIIGGQTIDGYKDGKLIRAWRDGKVLILDEMPRLDPNTAGLFNDALAKSSHTTPSEKAKINSANPEEPPYPRNNNFALIATGNVYPNTPPAKQYIANNQQDLSLLDRFSGSVYKQEYVQAIDEDMCRYQFLYDMLVGNYYDYMDAKKRGVTLPAARGLRTVLTDLNHTDKAVVSYRTDLSFRVSFECELVRAIQNAENPSASPIMGKTLVKAWNSFLVAFSPDVATAIRNNTSFTDDYVQLQADTAINMFLNKKWKDSLIPSVRKNAEQIEKSMGEIKLAENIILK